MVSPTASMTPCGRRCAMPQGVTRWPAPGSWTPSRSRAPTPVGACSRGYDAGKKVNGRKRHIVVDKLGLLIVVLVTAANLQDRDGGRRILDRARMAMPSIVLVWADGGYAGKLVAWVAQSCRIMLEIVRKPEGQRTFEVLPRRWVVERTLSWLMRWRRLDRDYERLPTGSMSAGRSQIAQ
jgi:transposase